MDRFALELVRNWMTRASHDPRSARLLSAADEPPLDIAIYHCQQVAEKSVKAWFAGTRRTISQNPRRNKSDSSNTRRIHEGDRRFGFFEVTVRMTRRA